MSTERQRLTLAYGASFDLPHMEKGMKGAIAPGRGNRGQHAGRLDAAAVQQPRPTRPERAPGAVVLGFNDDTGERYLPVEGFLPS